MKGSLIIVGICVFATAFALFLTFTYGVPSLPPGALFSGFSAHITNGLFYGFIISLVYGLMNSSFFSKAELKSPEPAALKPKAETMKETGIPIIEIEGIGPVYTKKLAAVDVRTTVDLLNAGRTPKGRKELAEKAGISEKLILEWVNLSDLFRIKGVAEEYSDLLEEAGVDTVVELSRRNPENLYAKMLEVNEEKKLVRRPPSIGEVKEWIEQAKQLPRKIEY